MSRLDLGDRLAMHPEQPVDIERALRPPDAGGEAGAGASPAERERERRADARAKVRSATKSWATLLTTIFCFRE